MSARLVFLGMEYGDVKEEDGVFILDKSGKKIEMPKEFELGNLTKIGRVGGKGLDIVLPSPERRISRNHAEIVEEPLEQGTIYTIERLSKGDVRINGKCLETGCIEDAAHNYVLRFGDLEFRLMIDGEPEEFWCGNMMIKRHGDGKPEMFYRDGVIILKHGRMLCVLCEDGEFCKEPLERVQPKDSEQPPRYSDWTDIPYVHCLSCGCYVKSEIPEYIRERILKDDPANSTQKP